jgi:hypothetical protein
MPRICATGGKADFSRSPFANDSGGAGADSGASVDVRGGCAGIARVASSRALAGGADAIPGGGLSYWHLRNRLVQLTHEG